MRQSGYARGDRGARGQGGRGGWGGRGDRGDRGGKYVERGTKDSHETSQKRARSESEDPDTSSQNDSNPFKQPRTYAPGSQADLAIQGYRALNAIITASTVTPSIPAPIQPPGLMEAPSFGPWVPEAHPLAAAPVTNYAPSPYEGVGAYGDPTRPAHQYYNFSPGMPVMGGATLASLSGITQQPAAPFAQPITNAPAAEATAPAIPDPSERVPISVNMQRHRLFMGSYIGPTDDRLEWVMVGHIRRFDGTKGIPVNISIGRGWGALFSKELMESIQGDKALRTEPIPPENKVYYAEARGGGNMPRGVSNTRYIVDIILPGTPAAATQAPNVGVRMPVALAKNPIVTNSGKTVELWIGVDVPDSAPQDKRFYMASFPWVEENGEKSVREFFGVILDDGNTYPLRHPGDRVFDQPAEAQDDAEIPASISTHPRIPDHNSEM